MPEKAKIPDNHVLAVLKGGHAAEMTVQDLNRGGFQKTDIVQGWDAGKAIDARGEDSNPFKGLIKRLASHVSDQSQFLQKYEEAAEGGAKVIAVKVDNDDEARRAAEILLGHGAADIRFFGRFAVRDLTPATNPSMFSDERPL